MKVSIITVCYNSAKTIEDTIRSVANQKNVSVEHLLIDGASTDETVKIIKQHESVTKLVSEPDRGIYDAMNKGIRLATGDIIGILNSDDVYYDHHVLENVSKVMSDVSIGACYGDLIYVDQGSLKNIIRYWKSCVFKKGLFKKGWVPPHPTFFVRRLVYEKYGLFDLNYPLAADFELMARLLERFQVPSVYVPKIFIKMRFGGATNNSVVNIIKQNIEIYNACKKNNVQLSLPFFFITKIVSRIKQFCARPRI